MKSEKHPIIRVASFLITMPNYSQVATDLIYSRAGCLTIGGGAPGEQFN